MTANFSVNTVSFMMVELKKKKMNKRISLPEAVHTAVAGRG